MELRDLGIITEYGDHVTIPEHTLLSYKVHPRTGHEGPEGK
jgi:hypothetical protein